MLKRLISACLFIFPWFLASATTYTVTTTADSGPGSLRQAINDVNVNLGNHVIAFNIPATDPNYNASQGIWKITPLSTMPLVMRSNVMIDGTTQTVNQGDTNPYGPEVMLDGEHAFGSDYGFHLYNVSGVTIQGLIIGRFTVGIEISGSNASGNVIRGNYIGCNYNATDTLSNTHGIEVLTGPHHNQIGGNTVADRNIISGNNHTGIRLVGSNYNSVKGNYVGLDRTGTQALRNYDGISIEGTSKFNQIGGFKAAERNFVSGNVAYGIPVFGAGCTGNLIVGNYIGTDFTGNVAVPNTYGVLFDDGASYNTVGGRTSGAGNLLSGNSGYGVFIYNPGTTRDTVVGNLIGTNAAGNAALPNANGIVIDGPSWGHYVDSNVISGNLQMGIDIHIGGSDSTVIIRNYIGTSGDGTLAIPNGIDGVRIGEGPRHNFIGLPGKGNVIAHNGGNGITVMTSAELYNTFSSNAIYSNGALGIDLFPEGVTLNDAGDGDTGPNGNLNFPVIDTVYLSGSDVMVTGQLDIPVPENARVELFLADPDPSGYGEGKLFLGSTLAQANGSWSCIVTGVYHSDFLTATATDVSGNTSEFSLIVPGPVLGIVSADLPENLLQVGPNPVAEVLNVSITGLSGTAGPMKASLYDETGSLVAVEQSPDLSLTLDVRRLATGNYFCVITLGDKIFPAVQVVKK